MKKLSRQVNEQEVEFKEQSAPATPASGYVRVYAKTDGKIYIKDDAGTETDLTGGSGSPGGSNTQVQYNNAGSFAGDAGLTYDATNDRLTVADNVTVGKTADGTSSFDGVANSTSGKQGLRIEGNSTSAIAFSTYVTADSNVRFAFNPAGQMEWGPGNASSDVTLGRSGAGVLAASGDITVADEAYGAGWDGSTEVPTKNAVYDKIQTTLGDVVGPASVTNLAIPVFDGTTGKLLKAAAGSAVVSAGGQMIVNSLASNNNVTASSNVSGVTLIGTTSVQTNVVDEWTAASGVTADGVLLKDGNVTFSDETTASKKMKFDLSGISTSTTRTITIPNAGTTMVGHDATQTLTNKRVTPRVGTTTSSATPTINTDNVDAYSITALAADITSFTTNLSGTPTDFQVLTIRIKDNGTERAITWGNKFESRGANLPGWTVATKVLTVQFIYDTVTAKWGCVLNAQEGRTGITWQ